jgi:NifU-like protein involved in Fe-S cluster formation
MERKSTHASPIEIEITVGEAVICYRDKKTCTILTYEEKKKIITRAQKLQKLQEDIWS